MKKIIAIAILTLSTMGAMAQTFHAPASKRAAFTDTTTTYKYVCNDNKTYNVFKSSKGTFYIWKKSKKSGKAYKMYLPKEIQSKMGHKSK